MNVLVEVFSDLRSPSKSRKVEVTIGSRNFDPECSVPPSLAKSAIPTEIELPLYEELTGELFFHVRCRQRARWVIPANGRERKLHLFIH